MNNIPNIPEPTLIQKITGKVIYGLITICTIVIIIFLYWFIQNPIVLEAKNSPFPLRPDKNIPGQIQFLHINYCKRYKATGTVVARLVGQKSIIRIPWPIENSAPQCLDTEAPVVIPTFATDDTYYFDFTITYQINPIKKRVVYLRSRTFVVDAQTVK